MIIRIGEATPPGLPAALLFLAALALTYRLTPVTAALARRWGWLDIPRGSLHVHAYPVPRAGGPAIAVVLAAGLLAALPLSHHTGDGRPALIGLLAACFLALFAGAWDDSVGLRPRYRLLIEGIASLAAIRFGYTLSLTGNSAWDGAISMLVLVGFANAFNLVDGMDGLAAGLGAVAAVFLAFLGAAGGDAFAATACAVLAGCCLGFLRHNLSPRKVFLGDSGSLLLGMCLGALAIRVSHSSGGDLGSIAMVFLVLAVPALDTAHALFRRLISGRSPFEGDRDHSYDRFLRCGWSSRATLALFLAAAGLIGVPSVIHRGGWHLAGLVILLLLVLIGTSLSRNACSPESAGKSWRIP